MMDLKNINIIIYKMKSNTFCILKKCFIIILVISFIYVLLRMLKKREGFLNLEKNYKSLKKDINFCLEGMITILPNGNLNLKRKARRLKRKYI